MSPLAAGDRYPRSTPGSSDSRRPDFNERLSSQLDPLHFDDDWDDPHDQDDDVIIEDADDGDDDNTEDLGYE
jgi:hypothetical protein